MARRKIDRNCAGPYHVSTRTINGDWFNIPMSRVWQIASEQLYFCKFAYELEIHSFVLMNNHYHLMLSTPNCNLSEAMKYFNREFSRQLNRDGNRINRTFAGRYYPCLLNSYHYFMNAYKYVYQNPLRAGICDRVEQYPFSTLNGLLGQQRLIIPISGDEILFDGKISENLKWLNHWPNLHDVDAVRHALRRGSFALPRDRKTKLPHRLETQLL